MSSKTRTPAIEEPRFTHRFQHQVDMDSTRITPRLPDRATGLITQG